MKNKLIIAAIVLFFAMFIPMRAEARDADGDIVIIVDPGHGGNDGGAVQNGLTEKELNWNIAVALKAELETYSGVKVYLTRGYSEWNTNTGRGRYGITLGADLFISCHNNSGSTTASGATAYGTVNPSYSGVTSGIGNKILAHLQAIGLNNLGYQTRQSTNDASRDFYTAIDEGIRAGIPSMIVEHCFISNASDASFISSTDTQYKVGSADADGIAEYYGLSKRTVAAGSSITLTRTYSACFTGVSGSFTSSDSSVAYVAANGLITACKAGTATISCTDSNGNVSSVNVTVPEVKQIGLAAGINPTFYADFNTANACDKSTVMVKCIYSDGSSVQVNGASFGNGVVSSDGLTGGVDIPVSYNGFSCNLRVYSYSNVGSYSANDYLVTGANKDILLIPGSYIAPNGNEAVTTPATVAPVTTAAPVTEPATTTEPATEAVTEETTVAETTMEETTIAETTEKKTTEAQETSTELTKDSKGSKTSAVKVAVVVLIIIAVFGVGVGAFFLIKRK